MIAKPTTIDYIEYLTNHNLTFDNVENILFFLGEDTKDKSLSPVESLAFMTEELEKILKDDYKHSDNDTLSIYSIIELHVMEKVQRMIKNKQNL